MPKNVLIPTDGTELSAKAAAYGIALAKQLGAKVTAVTVTTPAEAILIGEGVVVSNPAAYEENADKSAKATLGVVSKLAADAGVACETIHARDEQPWHGILEAGKAKGADLIVIASHGRRGLAALVMGSQTQKVASHSTIPVLIYRSS
ncbi:MAG: universal stress protein [Hyphomicrobiaceae bacterium]